MDKTDPLIVDACQERVGCRLTKMSEETVEVRAKIFLLESLEPPYWRTSKNCNDVVGSEVLEGVKFSRTPLGFKDINSLESFTIEVNGLIIDSELSEHARSKYYELCCREKSFLHDNLRETINCKLAAGIISQTINIADDIRTRKFTTSGDEFAEWDKNLAVLEQLGMNVGFLRTWIEKFVNLAYESEGMDSKKYREATLPASDAVKEVTRTQLAKHGEKARSDSEEFSSEVVKGLNFLRTPVDFKDINVLQNFPIAVNGLIINSDLSEQEHVKYYEMCCSQKAFLHDNLCETINCKFAVGLISQTIKIADEMRACKLTTSQDEFAEWDKTLGAFEQLGMNVGFLRARIKRLVNLVNELKGPGRKKYRKDLAEIDDVKKEMRTLKAKLVELEEASKRCDTDIEILEEKAQQYQLKFQAEVEATWEESKSL